VKQAILTIAGVYSFLPTIEAKNHTGYQISSGKKFHRLTDFLLLLPTTTRDYKDGAYEAATTVPVNALLGRAVHSLPGMAELSAGTGKVLNPRFVEEMMSVPQGWTSCACSAMELIPGNVKSPSGPCA
jgi:hypothetical protein